MPKGHRIDWTPYEDFIRANYVELTAPQIAERLRSEFGADIEDGALKSYMTRHNLHSGRTGRYEPGRTAENKGLHWSDYMPPESQARSRATTFKKGNRPQTWVPVGTEAIDKDGYRKIKVAEPNRWKLLHRYVWEQANGPIPDGCNVTFLDGDPQNCTLENLVLMTRRENAFRNCHLIQEAATPEHRSATIPLAKIRVRVLDEDRKRRKREG